MINGVIITPLKSISIPGGDVLHAMKCSDTGYTGFGEAYFSIIKPGIIKAWKRHKEMALNLIVPVGTIRFVMFDDNNESPSYNSFQDVVLSRNNYCRLTIPPMIWLGFQCVGEDDAMLLNLASIIHDPDEAERKETNNIEFDWST
jgi:dTDP-4-dehydrorhamnose 3,5-epimerase